MSVQPYVYLDYGYIFDADDEDFLASLKTMFPETAEDFVDGNGEIIDKVGLLSEMHYGDDFYQKYVGLSLKRVLDLGENLVQVIVVLSNGTKTLYNKYDGGPNYKAFYPLERILAVEPFEKFKEDFSVFRNPQPVIWSEWL